MKDEVTKIAYRLREIYWEGLGDPERAAAPPSGPSLDAWKDVAEHVVLHL